MTEDVVTAHPSWSIERLADFFMEYDISGAPVTNDDGDLVGVVSMSDITQYSSLPGESLPRPQPHQRFHLGIDSEYSDEDIQSFREQEWGGVTVEEIMTPMIFDVSEDASLDTIADTMLKGRIHRVLVTREKHLVGIITALDLIRVIRDAS
jgi:CBS domain-containing protein